jgi:hypothetical protein
VLYLIYMKVEHSWQPVFEAVLGFETVFDPVTMRVSVLDSWWRLYGEQKNAGRN